jgi:hypothetical protein
MVLPKKVRGGKITQTKITYPGSGKYAADSAKVNVKR